MVNLLTDINDTIVAGDVPVIVAHNAKFDLKYMMRKEYYSDLWTHCKVWDTMTWEYRTSGHTSKFASLEATAKRYAIPFNKTLDLGALIKAGVRMQDIPIDDLKVYLFDDVRALHQVWDAQVTRNCNWDMNYILPLAEMELNGLRIDDTKLSQMFVNMASRVDHHEYHMIQWMCKACEWQDGTPLDPLSDFCQTVGTKTKFVKPFARRTLSFLMTGVPAQLDITAKWKVKFRPAFGPQHTKIPYWYKGKTHLGFEIDEHVLKLDKNWILYHALKHRKANKILSTYLSPFKESMAIAGTVHPKLNTAITATGRLSSSAPNGQNMPPVVRKLVYADDGNFPHSLVSNKMYEIDFKQLEMVAVACISGCKQMLAALRRGDDLHYLSGKKVFGWTCEADMTETDRKVVKQVNFGVLYGGKAAGLSHLTGVSKDIIQQLIDGFYGQFPGVAKWQRHIFEEVVDDMVPLDVKDGVQRYCSKWTLPISGRKFTFIETEAPAWLRKKTRRKWSFSPTQTSNYPIQGFAGGDIVMYALTWLWRHTDNVRYVLTVHDSIVIESPQDSLYIRNIVLEMCRQTADHFNLPLELRCDVESGKHWQ
jgi:DNA polymerase I-like protein with 3'-5' exonuclease and polymerase domains